jgi:hypothetical protein
VKTTIDIPENILEEVAAAAIRHGLELEHCDQHFEKVLPIAAKL